MFLQLIGTAWCNVNIYPTNSVVKSRMVLTMGLKQYILGVLQCSEELLSCESYPVIPFGPMHQIITFSFLVSGPGTLKGGAKILELNCTFSVIVDSRSSLLCMGSLSLFWFPLPFSPKEAHLRGCDTYFWKWLPGKAIPVLTCPANSFTPKKNLVVC